MVHNSKARLQALSAFIVSTGAAASSFEVSDVKRDGTVFVKFKSTTSAASESAVDRACRFSLALQDTGRSHTCPTDVQIRLALDQF